MRSRAKPQGLQPSRKTELIPFYKSLASRRTELIPFYKSLALFLLTLALSGCDSGTLVLIPVHGKVSYNGIPLRAGTIVFTPDPLRGTLGPLARADIQSDGTYALVTDDKPGAATGWHRVTILAHEPTFATGPDGQRLVPRSLLPDKYRDPELSGLFCEIKPGQENRIDFNLD